MSYDEAYVCPECDDVYEYDEALDLDYICVWCEVDLENCLRTLVPPAL